MFWFSTHLYVELVTDTRVCWFTWKSYWKL